MSKTIGRNDLCPCNSGKKYKKCFLFSKDCSLQKVVQHFRVEDQKRAKLHREGNRLRFVKPIDFHGKKVWALRDKVYTDRPPNETFHEFIVFILQQTLGKEWWEEQQLLEEAKRHFIIRCFYKHDEWRRRIAKETVIAGKVWSAVPDGWSRSLISLAYDITSLIQTNKLPDHLMKRLRHHDQYQGARYEIMVAAVFARLGFEIEYLDDEARSEKHCEFYAKKDKLTIAVEAKSRHRTGVLNDSRPVSGKSLTRTNLGSLLNDALEKEHGDFPFLIFMDVNTAMPEEKWRSDVEKMLQKYPEPTVQNPEKYNALIITNFAYHYQTDAEAESGQHLTVIPQFAQHPLPNLRLLLDDVIPALNNYGNVPPLFVDNE